MVTMIPQIPEPPTPQDPPAQFNQKAADSWAGLYAAVPKMNQQAEEIAQISADAVVAAGQAVGASDQALGYRNEAEAARTAAQGAAATAGQHAAAAAQAGDEAEQSAVRAEEAAAQVQNRVQMTGPTGAALLPHGVDAERPGAGSIPAGWLLIRGSAQDPQGYVPEFYDRSASRGWQKLAAQYWVKVLTDALDLRLKELEKTSSGVTLLYPNGTAVAPYVIGPNATLDVVNPFAGLPVFVEPQILVGGVWADPKWSSYPPSPNSSYGVMATQLDETGNIRVRTGLNAVATTWRLTGSGLPVETNVTSAPLRLRVSKLMK